MYSENSVAIGLECVQELLKAPSRHHSSAKSTSARDTVKRLPKVRWKALLTQDEVLNISVVATLDQELLLVLTAFLSVDVFEAIRGKELSNLASAGLKVKNFSTALPLAVMEL